VPPGVWRKKEFKGGTNTFTGNDRDVKKVLWRDWRRREGNRKSRCNRAVTLSTWRRRRHGKRGAKKERHGCEVIWFGTVHFEGRGKKAIDVQIRPDGNVIRGNNLFETQERKERWRGKRSKP